MISKSLRTVLSNKLLGQDKLTHAFDLIIAEIPISNVNISIMRVQPPGTSVADY